MDTFSIYCRTSCVEKDVMKFLQNKSLSWSFLFFFEKARMHPFTGALKTHFLLFQRLFPAKLG